MFIRQPVKTRVLLIEDDEDYARLLKKVIALVETNRYEVEQAETLEEAIHCLKQAKYDLIISDLCLPDCQGLSTFREIQTHAGKWPIVILTNVDDENTALAAVREGAQDYIYKAQLNVPTLRRAITYAMERQREQIHRDSFTMIDEITELYNRRGFISFGKQLTKLCQRVKEPYALFYIDIDGLRTINEQYGFPEGDHVLQEVSFVLKMAFQNLDILARVGGDEFAVLGSGVIRDQARAFVENFEREIKNQPIQSERPYSVSAVFACCGEDVISLEEMLGLVESAMYARKLEYKQNDS